MTTLHNPTCWMCGKPIEDVVVRRCGPMHLECFVAFTDSALDALHCQIGVLRCERDQARARLLEAREGEFPPDPCACCNNPATHTGSDHNRRCEEHRLFGDTGR